METLTEKNSVWNKICCIFEILNRFTMEKLMYRIFGQPISRDRGVRGTVSGKLYIDKKVFFKRESVKNAISEIYASKIIKEQIIEAKPK